MKFKLLFLIGLGYIYVDFLQNKKLVLGDHLFYIGNMFLPPEKERSGNSIYNHGVIILLSITKHRVVILCDVLVYLFDVMEGIFFRVLESCAILYSRTWP